MIENDPYQPPAAELQAPVPPGPDGLTFATRESRLLAAMLDGVIMALLVLPLQWKMGVFDNPEANSALSTLAWGGASFLVYLVIQTYFLATRAQTVGKMALKIKIVTLDGNNADLKRILLLRLLPATLVSMVPVVGGVLSTVDTLFIFRDDQRCIHDHIAGTRVVKA